MRLTVKIWSLLDIPSPCPRQLQKQHPIRYVTNQHSRTNNSINLIILFRLWLQIRNSPQGGAVYDVFLAIQCVLGRFWKTLGLCIQRRHHTIIFFRTLHKWDNNILKVLYKYQTQLEIDVVFLYGQSVFTMFVNGE